jgi:heme/copper-type cytochrome/quinol oxidase subunit 4
MGCEEGKGFEQKNDVLSIVSFPLFFSVNNGSFKIDVSKGVDIFNSTALPTLPPTMPPATNSASPSLIIVIIVACIVVAFLIHICVFVKYKAIRDKQPKRWILASVVLGPFVWVAWWLAHRSTAQAPSAHPGLHPEAASSLSQPLVSKPSAPSLDDAHVLLQD